MTQKKFFHNICEQPQAIFSWKYIRMQVHLMAELLFYRYNGGFLNFCEYRKKSWNKNNFIVSHIAMCMSCESTFICIIILVGPTVWFCELNYICCRKYRTNLDNSVGWWNGIKIWQFVRRFWNLIKFNYSPSLSEWRTNINSLSQHHTVELGFLEKT